LTNPYAPARNEDATESPTQTNRLLYIWVWLPTAILGAMLATPADIFSIILAIAFALPCFLAGVVWTSSLDQMRRWMLIAVCTLIAGALAVPNWLSTNPIFVAIAIIFAGANVALGYKPRRSIKHKRHRIFTALSVSYTIGLLLGPLGVTILCVPSVLFANRNTASNGG